MIRLSASVSKKGPIEGLDYSSRSYCAGIETEMASGCSSEELQARLKQLCGEEPMVEATPTDMLFAVLLFAAFALAEALFRERRERNEFRHSQRQSAKLGRLACDESMVTHA